jgi:anti-anti-sigma factor
VNVTMTERDGVVVARVTGELSEASSDELDRALRAGVRNADTAVVVDLTAVTHMDSAGVHLLFDTAKRLGRRQQKLRVVAARDSVVGDMASLTDLGSYAPVDGDLGEALAQLQSNAA